MRRLAVLALLAALVAPLTGCSCPDGTRESTDQHGRAICIAPNGKTEQKL